MKKKFLKLTKQLFESSALDELNHNRITLNNFIVNLTLTIDNPEAELELKNHLIDDVNNYVAHNNDKNKDNLLNELQSFTDIIAE